MARRFWEGSRLGPLGNRPALEDAALFEPKVVMEAGGVVFLDDERAAGGRRLAAARLGSDREVALTVVFAQAQYRPLFPS
jgi:hypothetical protein